MTTQDPSPSGTSADADLFEAMRATARSIHAAQARAERELTDTRDQLRQQNAALARANALLQATMEATPVGVLAADRSGTVTLRNRRFAELWKLPEIDQQPPVAAPSSPPAMPDDALWTHLSRRLSQPDAYLAWQARVQAEPAQAPRLRCQTVDGRHFECQAVMQAIDDQVVGVVYNWLDVTEQFEAESLRAGVQAAQLAAKAKSAFMSRASHELRTPMNAVLGFSHLLQVNPVVAGDAKASRQVLHILTGGKHLLALLEDLMHISRMDADAVSFVPERFDLAELVDESIELSAPLALPLGLQVARHGTPAGCWVRVDRTRARQVLLNVLSNAMKYNRRGGSVHVSLEQTGHHCVVQIEDTGIGLTEEQLSHLFEPFNRLGAERTRIEGSGLGLAITQQLVERMGGTIEVASTPGTGSRFSVAFGHDAG